MIFVCLIEVCVGIIPVTVLNNVTYKAKISLNRSTLEAEFSSYDDMIKQIQSKWSVLKLTAFKLVISTTAKSDENNDLFDDDSMSNILNSTLAAGNVKNNIKVVLLSRGFSHYCTHKDDVSELFPGYSLNLRDEDFPPDQTVADSIYATEANSVQSEIARRAIVINDFADTCEYTMREFISPVLIGAVIVALSKLPSLRMVCEKRIVGRFAQGPVDYVLFLDSLFILLGEAKLNDMNGGAKQNYVQQRASQDSQAYKMIHSNELGAKRKADYLQALKVVQTINTAGVVSSGRLYQFSKCHFDDAAGQTDIRHSKVYELTLRTTCEAERIGQLCQIEKILRIIVGIILSQYILSQRNGIMQVQNDIDEQIASESLDRLLAGSHSDDDEL